ncbi:uncharacterized, partial [Tachysurus ichikawai]
PRWRDGEMDNGDYLISHERLLFGRRKANRCPQRKNRCGGRSFRMKAAGSSS